MSAKGGHTWELVSKSFNIPQHFHTYCRITCKVWRYSDALIKLEVFPIYKPLPRGPGSCTSLARCMLVDGMSGSFVRRCSQTRLTLSKILDLYVETPGTGQSV